MFGDGVVGQAGPVFFRGEMVAADILGLGAAPYIGVGAAEDFARGAIAGAFVLGAAFLAGLAIFKRSAAAVCALLMVAAAGALEFVALGLAPAVSPRILTVLEGVFGATVLIFLSATIRTARNNPVLGGLMFAAALTLVGIGVITLFGQTGAAPLVRYGLFGVAGFAVLLTLSQALRDNGARLIVPGAALAAVAPIVAANSGASFSITAHVLFAVGVLAAALVAIAETGVPRLKELRLRGDQPRPDSGVATTATAAPAERLRVSENQLAQVLDYSGVAVWDWSPGAAHQTDGLPTLVGAETRGIFSPDDLRAFIHKDDQARFDRKVIGDGAGDAGFDFILKVRDGRSLRFRGARAVASDGQIERLVAFIESVPDSARIANGPDGTVCAHASGPMKASSAAALAGAFAEALDKGEISTVFQPIVDLESGRVAGYETLARWRGKDGDRTGAEELVRAAHVSGKASAFASFTLKAAVAFLSARLSENADASDMKPFVAFNVSYEQIRAPGFAEEVAAAIVEEKLPGRSLVLELTETDAITDATEAARIFEALRTAGAALAFDDFGAGFSSLRHLQRFPFDYIKIDKSFVAGLGTGEGAVKVTRAIAALGRDLGMTVIAEGIETKDTAAAAKAAGCSLGQGFAFGAPQPAAAAEADAAAEGADQGKRRALSREMR